MPATEIKQEQVIVVAPPGLSANSEESSTRSSDVENTDSPIISPSDSPMRPDDENEAAIALAQIMAPAASGEATTGPTPEEPLTFRPDPRTIQALMQERQVTKEEIFELLCSGYIEPNIPVRPSASPIDAQLRYNRRPARWRILGCRLIEFCPLPCPDAST